MSPSIQSPMVPRIEELSVRNYRALKNLQLKELTPLSVLLGPNGSGKSTVFDVFAFLSECFTEGLRRAWDRRGRFKELRTRGAEGPIVIELKYRERPRTPLITYHLEVDEGRDGPYLAKEWLHWRRGQSGRPFRFLDFEQGEGNVIQGEEPDESATREPERLEAPDTLAVNALGQLANHPRVVSLRRFITGWYLSYLSADSARGVPEAGPQERLSESGDNLPNVTQYLKERHDERLTEILGILRERVPRLEKVETKIAPHSSTLVGIEMPENHLHPNLHIGLAGECREAAARTQLLVTTHSPFFVNGLKPRELRALHRNERGFTQARRVSEIEQVETLMEHGGLLGDLWMEGYFDEALQPATPGRVWDGVGRRAGLLRG